MATKKEERGRRLSYKFRIYPTAEQERVIDMNFGCCRYVFNHYLTKRRDAWERTQTELSKPKLAPGADPDAPKPEYEHDEKGHVVYEMVPNDGYDPDAKSMSFFDTSKDLTRLKKELVDEDGHAWLKDADSTALVYSLRNLDAAYQNFFRGRKRGEKIGYPRYKSKRNPVQSYKTASPMLIGTTRDGKPLKVSAIPSPVPEDSPLYGADWRYVRLPKVGDVRTKVHRVPEGEFVSATISRHSGGRYFVAINVKEADIPATPKAEGEVGITFGVSHWVVTSTGEVEDLPRQLERLQRRKAIAQRDLARKKEGSANYRKAKAKAARIDDRIAAVRRDATHKLTHQLVAENDVIASRKMSSQEMQRHDSAATKKLPRKTKKYLNKMISDGNFFEFNRQLAYKAQWANRAFVEVPSDAPTAQVCSHCGHKHTVLAGDLRPTWVCPECGTNHDRKLNGADNVLSIGMSLLRQQEDELLHNASEKKQKQGKEK